MTPRTLTMVATALWATAVTSVGFAFGGGDSVGLFETANMVALIACVPTFWLCADALLDRLARQSSREHEELLGDLCEIVDRADGERQLPRVGQR